jgi:hypothetical protein
VYEPRPVDGIAGRNSPSRPLDGKQCRTMIGLVAKFMQRRRQRLKHPVWMGRPLG